MASERVSFGTTCINRENRRGELWSPKPFPSVPLTWEQTGVLQQIQAEGQGWAPDSPPVRPPADGSQPSSLVSQPTPRPAYTPVPSLIACSFPRILLASDKSHLSSGLLARFWSSWAIPDKAD